MNQTTIAGHLGADPEVRFTSSGKKVTTLRVAARARRNAAKEDQTIWWKVSVWGEEFDKMLPYFKKGSSIVIVGEMNKPEIFTDREGKPQISMSLTASNLMFNPFGKPDHGTHQQQGQQVASEPAHAHAETAPTAQEAMMAGQAAMGQGKIDPSFNEDEIPF